MVDLILNQSDRRRAASAAGLLLFALTAHSAAVTPPALDSAFTWVADVVSSDFRNNTLDVSGNVRVTQGSSSIEAQTAKARDIRSDTQRWTFEDAVRIRTSDADLQSNIATAAVVNGAISNARVEGTPARFEQVSPTNNRQVRGRAGVIEYDLNTGVVKLTNQVWFSNGKDEIRGDVVIYNVRDGRVQAGGSSNRVRGIIRPNQDKTPNKSDSAAGTAAILEPTFNENGGATTDERVEPKLATESGGGA